MCIRNGFIRTNIGIPFMYREKLSLALSSYTPYKQIYDAKRTHRNAFESPPDGSYIIYVPNINTISYLILNV